jgi:cell wall-associated NlpC family hydrolase
VDTQPSARTWYRIGGAAVAVSLVVAGVLSAVGGTAGAAPQPTVTQVQQRIKQLTNQAGRVGQQYDQVLQELSSANQRLKVVSTQARRYRARFDAMRSEVAQIAATAYENGSLTSVTALLTSGNPQQLLNQSSILVELSASNSAAMSQFLTAARQYRQAELTAQRTRAGIAALKRNLANRKRNLDGLISQQRSLLAQLTPTQKAATTPGGGTTSGGGSGYTGPTSTQAQKAVAFAYAQLGCPYVYGGTGPCSAGFDCSGLTMEAWAAAGVSIPRTSYEQIGSLPQVSLSSLQPGDILGFAGNSHVGIYVGGGYLIDAPVPGASVEKVALSGWYQQNLDAAVRP